MLRHPVVQFPQNFWYWIFAQFLLNQFKLSFHSKINKSALHSITGIMWWRFVIITESYLHVVHIFFHLLKTIIVLFSLWSIHYRVYQNIFPFFYFPWVFSHSSKKCVVNKIWHVRTLNSWKQIEKWKLLIHCFHLNHSYLKKKKNEPNESIIKWLPELKSCGRKTSDVRNKFLL